MPLRGCNMWQLQSFLQESRWRLVSRNLHPLPQSLRHDTLLVHAGNSVLLWMMVLWMFKLHMLICICTKLLVFITSFLPLHYSSWCFCTSLLCPEEENLMISLSSGSQLNSRVHGELLCLQLFVSLVHYLYFSTSFIPLPVCYASKQGLLTTGFNYQQNQSVQRKGRNPEISSFHFLFQLSNKVEKLLPIY